MGKIRRRYDGHCCAAHKEVWTIDFCRVSVSNDFASSGLPDYVFDLGERPAKGAQKRTKVCFFLLL